MRRIGGSCFISDDHRLHLHYLVSSTSIKSSHQWGPLEFSTKSPNPLFNQKKERKFLLQEDLPGWTVAWRGTLKMPVPPPAPENFGRDPWWSEPSEEEEGNERKWLTNSGRWWRPLHWSSNRGRLSSVHPQSGAIKALGSTPTTDFRSISLVDVWMVKKMMNDVSMEGCQQCVLEDGLGSIYKMWYWIFEMELRTMEL